ncbi:MAG: sulfatase/phosphatase domain-containing protein [Isosphaeraceae bacterium]
MHHRHTTCRIFVAAWLLALAGAEALAQLPQARLEWVFPAGLQAGSTANGTSPVAVRASDWAGVPAAARPARLEGGSIARLIADGGQGSVARPREELLFHFPHYQSGHTPHSAIRVGDLKLIHFYEDDSVKLFDLQADPSERNDLAEERPDVTTALRTRLDAALEAVDAQRPTRNLDGAGGDPPPRRGKGGRRGGRNSERDEQPGKKGAA